MKCGKERGCYQTEAWPDKGELQNLYFGMAGAGPESKQTPPEYMPQMLPTAYASLLSHVWLLKQSFSLSTAR
jgi:hypothetical protein